MMAVQPELESFRDWFVGEYRSDGLYDGIQMLEGAGADSASLSVRLLTGGRSYYEARADLAAGELQVGFGTESQVINDRIEQMILDNGGDLSDLLGGELRDLGEEPRPMEHCFERPAFRYLVCLGLRDPGELNDPVLRRRVKAILKASRILFQDCVDEAGG